MRKLVLAIAATAFVASIPLASAVRAEDTTVIKKNYGDGDSKTVIKKDEPSSDKKVIIHKDND